MDGVTDAYYWVVAYFVGIATQDLRSRLNLWQNLVLKMALNQFFMHFGQFWQFQNFESLSRPSWIANWVQIWEKKHFKQIFYVFWAILIFFNFSNLAAILKVWQPSWISKWPPIWPKTILNQFPRHFGQFWYF